jgi:hypothetical protein
VLRKEFEAWLRAQSGPTGRGYSYSVIKGYPAECGWVERNLEVDLDDEYAKDGLASVLNRLAFKNGHPLESRIDGRLYNNLATYKRAVASYINYIEARDLDRATPARAGFEVAPVVPSLPDRPESARVPSGADVVRQRDAVGWAELVCRRTVSELLALHAAVAYELCERGVLRSSNGPGGDYAEFLFARAFGLTRTENSTAGYDAVDWSERRYQIKSRRLTTENTSRQLGALRRLPDQNFDYLAAVLFDKDYQVGRAAMIPHATVLKLAKFQEHTNSWTLVLDEHVWDLPDVRDVTPHLRRAAAELDMAAV